MAQVPGNVATFGLESISIAGMRLIFTPSGPAMVEPRYLLVSKPVEVSVAVDGSGQFLANLAPTDDMHPLRWYTVRAEWPDAPGRSSQVEFLDWKLYVPSQGGDFADLVQFPTNPQLAWTSLTEPPHLPSFGSLWLESNPSDPSDPANTGNLYQWEN